MPAKVHIFYAWQSDTPAALNHRFNRDAAQQAIDKLKADAELDEADAFDRLELDHDTKGVPGSPNVAETICRKIDACTLFIGDVTTFGEYARRSDGAVKKTANANVLIELGYARRSKGVERIVTVQNRAFGSPDDLPFDLKYLRHPIQYTLADEADPEFARKRSELAGQFKVALRAILTSDSFAVETEGDGRTAAAAAAAEAARLRADGERAAFEAKVLGGEFYGFHATRGVLTLSVIPLKKPRRLDLAALDRDKAVADFRPIRADSWSRDRYGRALVTHQTFTDDFRRKGTPGTLAELTDGGSIFAADNWLKVSFSDNKEGEVVNVRMNAYEPETVWSLAGYLRMLRAIGVVGPLQVGLSLLRIKRFRLLPRDRGFAYDEGRPFEADEYRTQPVVIEDGQDVASDEAVAKAIRPALDEVWRECGFPFDIYFDPGTGEYKGFTDWQR